MVKTSNLLELLCEGKISIRSSDHPNELNFSGVLVRLDEPSTKPPNGAEGHRIYVSSAVAKSRLKTLIGMGLNYSPTLDTHAQKRKVGVIKRAWIDGQDLCVTGVIWKHDFPEATKDLTRRADLGMSMEIGKVEVQDVRADVWQLSDFYFLGATILKKDAAAYRRTQAIAAKADERSNMEKNKKVKQTAPLTPEKITELALTAAAEATAKTFGPLIGRQMKLLKTLNAGQLKTELALSDLTSRLEVIEGAGEDDEEITITSGDAEEEAAGDVKAKAKKGDVDPDDEDDDDDDDEEDMESSEDISHGDLEEMGPETGDDEFSEDLPGQLNKDAKNQGKKQVSDDKLGKNINEPVTGSQMRVLVKAMKAMQKQMAAFAAENVTLKRTLKKVRVQAKSVSASIERKSLTPDIISLLAKSGVNADDLQASGQKLEVSEVDSILAGVTDITQRMEVKNKLRNANLMVDGAVNRHRNVA